LGSHPAAEPTPVGPAGAAGALPLPPESLADVATGALCTGAVSTGGEELVATGASVDGALVGAGTVTVT
jgi:hypothetical protein